MHTNREKCGRKCRDTLWKGRDSMQNKGQNLNRDVLQGEPDISQAGQIMGKDQEDAYAAYVKRVTPTHNLWLQMVKAFLVGGIICCIGQYILNTAINSGLDRETAGNWCSMLLVLLSVILTGFGIYPKIVKWGGAGALVPITGFANSVAAPAIEYKTEGQVFGIGCKIFTIAGPVLLYGILSSWLLGLVYLLVG